MHLSLSAELQQDGGGVARSRSSHPLSPAARAASPLHHIAGNRARELSVRSSRTTWPCCAPFFPTLTSRGAYRNIYLAEYYMCDYENLEVRHLGLFKHSHITNLWLDDHTPDVAWVTGLVNLLETGRLRFLGDHDLTTEQLALLMEAISALPRERSLTSLSVRVHSPSQARALLSLAASSATHALQNIRLMCHAEEFGNDEASTEISVFWLLTILTLRSLVVIGEHWPFLTFAHVAVIIDCVRTRAQSGAPPLHTLSLDESSHEDDVLIINVIKVVMKNESPSTSVLVGDYCDDLF